MRCATWIFVYASLSLSYIVVSCAGDRSNAATFRVSTPSVTSWWAGARRRRRRREKEKLVFEKNRRVVLKMHDEHGRCSTEGHLAHDPGRVGGKTGGGGSRSSRLLSPTRTHHLRHQHRMAYRCCKYLCAIRSGERRQQRKPCSWQL